MPVPKRRTSLAGGIQKLALKLFDLNYIFSKTRVMLLYGYAPMVLYIGMTTEPTPASWFEIINILE